MHACVRVCARVCTCAHTNIIHTYIHSYIHTYTHAFRPTRERLVISWPPPEEGVHKLCAVAQWKGSIDWQDVSARLEELVVKCQMDGLIPRKDQGLGPRITTSGV